LEVAVLVAGEVDAVGGYGGDDLPAGMGVFQVMFLEEEISCGRGAPSAMPEPLGPRRRVQSAAGAARVRRRRVSMGVSIS